MTPWRQKTDEQRKIIVYDMVNKRLRDKNKEKLQLLLTGVLLTANSADLPLYYYR